jgi:predicted AAA+ superfamily ATPase
MINEIRKQNAYKRIYANVYFWRNTEQKEIDLILEKDNHLHLYEFKWNPLKTSRLTKSFSNIYSNFTYEVVSQENFSSFLTTFGEKKENPMV